MDQLELDNDPFYSVLQHPIAPKQGTTLTEQLK